MKVEELVRELQRLDRLDMAVHIPCPHCCGQHGTDFDLLDAEFIGQVERDGQQVSCWVTHARTAWATGGPTAGSACGRPPPDIPRPSPPAWGSSPCGPSSARTGADISGHHWRPFRQEQVQPFPPAQPGDRGDGWKEHPVRDGRDAVPGLPGGHRPGPEKRRADDGTHWLHLPPRDSVRGKGPVGRGGYCFRRCQLAFHRTWRA